MQTKVDIFDEKSGRFLAVLTATKPDFFFVGKAGTFWSRANGIKT